MNAYSIEEVVTLLKELVSLMELKGENPFKVRAYEKAIDLLKACSMSFETLISKLDGGSNLGFGPQIIKDLKEIKSTGKLALHQAYLEEIPREVLELLNIRGLGPKKIIQLQKELEITSVYKFEEALNKGTLKKLKGFGDKTLISLKENLDFYLNTKGYFLIDTHEHALTKTIELSPGNLLPIGNSSEKAEVFSKVELALCHSKVSEFKASIVSQNIPLTNPNSTNLSLIINSIPVNIEIKEEAAFLELKNKEKVRTQEFNLTSSSLKGLLHMHSTYSDGLHSIRELADEAMRLGYTYIGISDHSQSAAYAGGLRPDDIKAQHIEIDRLNNELAPFRIFKGIESDILTDGSLDYNDKVLASFDFIIASVHSGFTLSKEDMTKRIIKAIKNPHTNILGHPTGRLLLKRKGYEVDVQELLKVAREEGVVVEINSNPRRLDVSWEEIKKFGSIKNSWAITPDAHSKEQLSLVKYGIMMANKAGVDETSILNCSDTKACYNFFNLRKNNG